MGKSIVKMSIKLSGVALGAMLIGLITTGEAKADAIAYANLDTTSADFVIPNVSGTPNLTNDISVSSYTVSVTEGTTFNGVSGSGGGAFTNGTAPYAVSPAAAVQGTYVGNANNFGFTGTNTNFTRSLGAVSGNVFNGGIASNTLAETQVSGNTTASAGTTSGTTTTLKFTANTNVSLQFTMSGLLTLYADTYNSNSNAQSVSDSATLSVTLKDDTTNSYVTLGPGLDDDGALSSSSSVSASGSDDQEGSLGANPFDLTSDIFTLVTGDSYTLTYDQDVTTDATSVDTASSVPEPGSLALLGSGIIGLIALRRRRSVRLV
jgi:trimeric autotransporter adhesin